MQTDWQRFKKNEIREMKNTDIYIVASVAHFKYGPVLKNEIERMRETDRQTDRQRQTDKKTELILNAESTMTVMLEPGRTERQTYRRQTMRQRQSVTDRQRAGTKNEREMGGGGERERLRDRQADRQTEGDKERARKERERERENPFSSGQKKTQAALIQMSLTQTKFHKDQTVSRKLNDGRRFTVLLNPQLTHENR